MARNRSLLCRRKNNHYEQKNTEGAANPGVDRRAFISRALNADEVAELRAQLENHATNGANVTQTQLQSDPKDEAAFKWINWHGKEYPGEWLALDGDRLLAHGPDMAEVAAAARVPGVQFPLLHLVEPPREYPYK